jgi:aconitate hydratase
MAPEYGATMGFFPIDEQTVTYLRGTGRSDEHIAAYESYYRAQGLWGTPRRGEIDYSVDLELDLSTVVPAVSGPRRPQDRIELTALKNTFERLFSTSVAEGGYGKSSADLDIEVPVHIDGHKASTGAELASTDVVGNHPEEAEPKNKLEMVANRPTPHQPSEDDTPGAAYRPSDTQIGHGSVLIASITSCTNTSNPTVMLAAGLLAKRLWNAGCRLILP